jgi:FAD/FMN-containing dehydrogenase
MTLPKKFLELFKGKIDEETLEKYSKDASLFKIKPEAVVFPKNVAQIKDLVRYVKKHRKYKMSITPRAGGTDMTGGPLSESVVMDMSNFAKIGKISDDKITIQTGAYYRDLDAKTQKKNLFLPSYPASREICTIGGMIANNSGGEKSLHYGKTINYVTELKVVLQDGEQYTVKKLSRKELDKKMKLRTFEGMLYKDIFKLVDNNYDLIKKSEPQVPKNSTGYNLWDVWDKTNFDLTKLFVGSQGTLGIIIEAELNLVPKPKATGLLIIFCPNLEEISDIVESVLSYRPSSFESFDNHTFKLAIKFFPEFLKLLGAKNIITLSTRFIPEFGYVLMHGIPKLTLLVEFEGADNEEIANHIKNVQEELKRYKVKTRIATSQKDIRKYWIIRRESFNLLRKKIKDKQTAPFIDDMCVPPERFSEYFPALIKILEKYNLLYTIAGHIGEGNFHVIPLMDLSDGKERKKIKIVSEKVYDLVLSLEGSISGEHNDGLIRGPYLEKMYGKEMTALFKQVKNIFDPKNIFNPGKKVQANMDYALKHIKRE